MAYVAPTYELRQSVVFVGFMGAGKTSTARRLARMCGAASIDMDCYIQRRTHRSVAEIFADGGEALYCEIETCFLDELTANDPLLISCAGGIATLNEQRKALFQRTVVVYLRISPDEARDRISNFKHRPMFGTIEQARELHARCVPVYEELADVVVDVSNKNVSYIAREVRRALVRNGALCEREAV